MKFQPGNAWDRLSPTEYERMCLLSTTLASRGMELRRDSRLSYIYIKGDCTDPVDQVADELIAVDFLHKMTSYGADKQAVFRALGERLHREHNLTWDATWDLVRFYAPCMFKMYALQTYNRRIPFSLSHVE